ncbi:MAG: rod shape-determining protein MreC [Dehalococcoidia bacterium]|nr:rod shape-determining protein MreC [Dehalococcoidia bacterium]
MLIFSRYTWWVAAMIGLALFLTAASQVGVLSPFQSAFLRVVAPVEDVINGIFTPVANILANAGRIDELEEENRALRVENADLTRQMTENEIDRERLAQLEQAFNLTGDTETTRVAANIVHRDASAFAHVLSIDRGSDDGIKVGMNVLSPEGWLVGTVYDVSGSQSFVRLITDSRSKVNAQVLGSETDGAVHGGANRTLSFELVTGDVNVGDTIVTSGLGGNYQANIPIAAVTEVSGTAQDLYRTVKLEPKSRVSTLSTVFVLTSFVPQRLGLESD